MLKILLYQVLLTEVFAIFFMIVFFVLLLLPCGTFLSNFDADMMMSAWFCCSVFWAIVCALGCNAYIFYMAFQQAKRCSEHATYSEVFAWVAS